MKVAVYAGISADKQSESSPEDEVADCQRFASVSDWELAEVTLRGTHRWEVAVACRLEGRRPGIGAR